MKSRYSNEMRFVQVKRANTGRQAIEVLPACLAFPVRQVPKDPRATSATRVTADRTASDTKGPWDLLAFKVLPARRVSALPAELANAVRPAKEVTQIFTYECFIY